MATVEIQGDFTSEDINTIKRCSDDIQFTIENIQNPSHLRLEGIEFRKDAKGWYSYVGLGTTEVSVAVGAEHANLSTLSNVLISMIEDILPDFKVSDQKL